MSNQPDSLNITTAGGGGAFVSVGTTMRDINGYFVHENELSQLGTLNGGTGFAVSFGTISILLAVGLKVDAIMQGLLTSEGEVLVQVGVPVLGIAGVSSYVVAFFLNRLKGAAINKIKSETRGITQSSSGMAGSGSPGAS